MKSELKYTAKVKYIFRQGKKKLIEVTVFRQNYIL